jgi:hypothetical protein
MLSNELLQELHQLSRSEKLRVVQMLVNELAEEEILTASDYEVWSPYDSAGAATILTEMLEG